MSCLLISINEDVEDLISNKAPGRPSGTVFPYVGVACLGAFLFGYHLGYEFHLCIV
jgi:hypothetical protein